MHGVCISHNTCLVVCCTLPERAYLQERVATRFFLSKHTPFNADMPTDAFSVLFPMHWRFLFPGWIHGKNDREMGRLREKEALTDDLLKGLNSFLFLFAWLLMLRSVLELYKQFLICSAATDTFVSDEHVRRDINV